MKRLVICCDGTWQRLASPFPTNVERIAQAVKSRASDGIAQTIYYHEGIGTWDKVDKWFGGAFGIGIDQHIQAAYLFLSLNYDPGDEIYFFGFSRGAYTVRSLAGMLNRCGLLTEQNIRQIPRAYELYRRPKSLTAQQEEELRVFRRDHCISCDIHLLGCFDTVGSLGIPNRFPWLPDRLVNDRLRFHDTTISKIVKHALHACAIDERRRSFDITPMVRNEDVDDQCVEQAWFVGDHGCVGGGDPEKVWLSNITLHWVTSRIRELGLGLEMDFSAQADESKVNNLRPFSVDSDPIYQLVGTIDRTINHRTDCIHDSALDRFMEDDHYRPPTLLDELLNRIDWIKPGESKSFVVNASKLWNASGVGLEAGATYNLAVDGNQCWKDWYIVTDANGYTSPLLRLWEVFRRVPSATWFKLIGAIAKDGYTPIVIGSGLTDFSPATSGELFSFANDIPWMYWNNRGTVLVTVTRLS